MPTWRRGGGGIASSAGASGALLAPLGARERVRRVAGVAASLFAAVCVGLWLLAVAGRPGPVLVERAVLAAAALATCVWIGLAFGVRLAGVEHRRRRTLLLAGLLVLALAMRFTGLGHELVDRPYLDEGTYWTHARQINGGEPWSASFVYPHLTYQLDAFTLWAADPWRPWLEPAFAAWRGAGDPAAADPRALDWLLMRALVALAGALTVIPVFRIAERITTAAGGEGTAVEGLAAGTLGALLVTFAPHYNEVAHLAITDLPSAFFAAVCLAACARLLDRECAAGYLAAGAAAGLAAGAKYPAGVVAVAVAAVWLRHRWFARRAQRRQRAAGSAAGAVAQPGEGGGAGSGRTAATRRAAAWGSTGGLLLAAAAAVAVFLLATPSFLVFPEQAFGGERGVFFGVRQYGAGGWIGVMPDSNALFYGRLAASELGWPAAVLGLAGLAVLGRRRAVRLAWLLPFPVAYLLLVAAMSMVVRRNLVPVIPALAAFAGAGLAAGWAFVRRRAPAALAGRRGNLAAAVLALLLLLPPASRSVAGSIAMARPSTRELARAWLLDHAPPGSAVLRESYGPDLPPERFEVWRSRFAARFPLAELRAGQVDYLLLTSAAHRRFLDPEAHRKAHHATYGDWYREVFAEVPLAARIVPGRFTWGPVVRIHRLPPAEVAAAALRIGPERLFVPDGGMRRPRAVAAFRPGQWTLAKADLAAGRWRLSVEGPAAAEVGRSEGREGSEEIGEVGEFSAEPAAGTATRLRLVAAGGAPLGEARLPGGGVVFRVPEPGRVFLYLDLPEGARVTGLRLEPLAVAAEAADTASAAGTAGEDGAPAMPN